MIETFFLPATTPFAVAICLMLFIAAVELIGALMGIPASAMLDSLLPEIDVDLDVDIDAEVDFAGGALEGDVPNIPAAPSAGPLSQILGWLCVGKVPILVLLIVFLTAFGLAGFFIQSTIQAIFGTPLPAILAVIPAMVVAIPATRVSGLTLSKLMPKEQTEAVSQRHFIGKVAKVVRGTARKGAPAEAKLTDSFGQTHYILVEPDDEAGSFTQGTEVIVVKQLGSVYRAILNTSAALSNEAVSDNVNENGGDNV